MPTSADAAHDLPPQATPHYADLDVYSDLVAAARASSPLYPDAHPGAATQQRVRQALRFAPWPDQVRDVRTEGRWTRDGIAGEALSWSVGYGPRTEAWLLRPQDAGDAALPGVVALHDHGGFKYCGKEKIADGPEKPAPCITAFRRGSYGGAAFANDLARRGYAVLVPDVYTFGSRRMPTEKMPAWILDYARLRLEAAPTRLGEPPEIALHNYAAALYELMLEKYCCVLGTTFAGIISFEDRAAAHYLAARVDVRPGGVGCVGLSGGGARSALLQATCDHIRAAIIVGMMGTYQGLLDNNIKGHTWMMFPAGWARQGDWTDLAACRAPSPLLVQYDLQDHHFPEACMREADARIAQRYETAGARDAYRGAFYPGPHKFDQAMQADAWDWLDAAMAPRA